MIAASLDDPSRARSLLTQAVALDPSFDQLLAARARESIAGLP